MMKIVILVIAFSLVSVSAFATTYSPNSSRTLSNIKAIATVPFKPAQPLKDFVGGKKKK